MKSWLFFAFFFLALFCRGQYLSDSLILWYPFNGNALDSSVNQYHGLTNAEFCPDHEGNPNSALHFNGYDQYFNFPPKGSKLEPELPISIAFWVMYENVSMEYTFLIATDYDQDNYAGIFDNIAWSGAYAISYGDGTGHCGPETRRSAVGSTVIEPFTWYYIIFTIRGADDMQIYVNGNPEEMTYDGFGGPLGYSDCQGGLGRRDGSDYVSPLYFLGSIDDFRYWSRSLNQQDIDSLCLSVGIRNDNNITGKVEVYPNPASTDISFKNVPGSVAFLEITDLAGKPVRTMEMSDKADISFLAPGQYFVRFLDRYDKKVRTARFVKL
jgi:hypothetical protein